MVSTVCWAFFRTNPAPYLPGLTPAQIQQWPPPRTLVAAGLQTRVPLRAFSMQRCVPTPYSRTLNSHLAILVGGLSRGRPEKTFVAPFGSFYYVCRSSHLLCTFLIYRLPRSKPLSANHAASFNSSVRPTRSALLR